MKKDDSIIQIFDSTYEYRQGYPKYEFQPSKWRIVPESESKLISENKLAHTKKIVEVFMLLELWNLHLIDKFEISFLLQPIMFEDKNGVEEHDLMKYHERIADFYDETVPVNIYISYPFSVDMELEVFPITKTKRMVAKILPIGYLAWQVSKLFEKLFKNRFDNNEITGLSYLQLTSFSIFENNNFVLDISS